MPAPKGNKYAIRNKGGRHTLYDKNRHPRLARKFYLLGFNDEEMADFLGVTVQTLHGWRKKHKEFFEASMAGKAAADADVAESLYDRAMGYSHPAVKIFMPQGAKEPV